MIIYHNMINNYIINIKIYYLYIIILYINNNIIIFK